MEKRTCRKCAVEQPIESFNRNPKSTGGRQWKCKGCEKRYRIENKERIARVQTANRDRRRLSDQKRAGTRKRSKWNPSPDARKHLALKWKYGIGLDTLTQMIAAQKGRCAICRQELRPDGRLTRPNVDHCHDTGRVRGVLCGRCNFALGFFQDDPIRLQRAIEYLT